MTTWQTYKKRIDSAFLRVENTKNAVITSKVGHGMNLTDAINQTGMEAYRILSQVGVFDYKQSRIVTKRNWEQAGYPVIKKLDEIPLFNEWKGNLRRG